jgi:hypothetical protein
MVGGSSLAKRVKALGLPLFKAEDTHDVNLTLADTVRSRDLRLLEGFPVLLVNAAEREGFSVKNTEGYLRNAHDKDLFKSLIAMSLALYRSAGMKYAWTEGLRASLSAKYSDRYNSYLKALKGGGNFRLGKHAMSARRVNATFGNYSKLTGSRLNGLLAAKEELGVEYALSQVFSPKQKELFLKKLKGEKLTKTEREYFSRVVKKKALALANTELHRLAQNML